MQGETESIDRINGGSSGGETLRGIEITGTHAGQLERGEREGGKWET